MKITAQEEYGLRCILQLASVPAGEPLAGAEIARRECLSYPYVEKLLWTLKRAGLTKSHRGVKGGYVLSRSPEEISLGDVQRAFGSLWATKDICSRHTGNRSSDAVVVQKLPEFSIEVMWRPGRECSSVKSSTKVSV